jgi:hypothetical protein
MNGRKDRGVVLVAVLFAVAIMSVMVVAASALTRSGIASLELEQRRFATELALRSGLEAAKALIVTTLPAQRSYFDGAPLAMDLGNGLSAEVTIRDAAGLADLNRTGLPLVESLLLATLSGAEATELFKRISELRAPAEKTKPVGAAPPPDPAEGAMNAQETKPGEPPVAAPPIFLAVDQLRSLAESQSADRLGQWFTVFNPTGLVNPLAAPDDVLLAIPGFSEGDLSAVEAARKNRAPQADQALQPMLGRLKDFLAIGEAPNVFVIGIRLNDGPGIIAQSTASAVVQIAEQGPLPFRTLSVSGL